MWAGDVRECKCTLHVVELCVDIDAYGRECVYAYGMCVFVCGLLRVLSKGCTQILTENTLLYGLLESRLRRAATTFSNAHVTRKYDFVIALFIRLWWVLSFALFFRWEIP